MPRLCSESSRSYPGRSAWHAAQWAAPVAATQPVIRQKSAEVIVGEGRRFLVADRLETSCVGIVRRWTHPTEGPNSEQGRSLHELA